MKIETLSHFADTGWSAAFPQLDSPETLVLAFGPSALIDDGSPLAELMNAYPQAHILACSSAGEIHGTRVHDDSITVAVAHFERTALRTVSVPLAPGASYEAGSALGAQLADPELRGVLLLSDGLGVNGSALAHGISASLGEGVVVTGGLAGDGDRFARTWVVHERRPTHGYATAVGLYGEHVGVGHGSKGGWDVFGPERIVTRSSGNVLFELDGQPALVLYKEYLGDLAAELPASGLLFPLAIRDNDADAPERVVRTILGIDEEQNALTFAGDIPEGAYAQLMRANFDRLVQGASDAALMTRGAAIEGSEVLCVAISCVGRRLVLRQRTEEETEATLEILPPGTRQIGFYSYGELSPHASGPCALHNQTMTLTTFTEA